MPLRIAMFVGSFPVVSETFIVNQITGLLDLGHDVDIFAELRTPFSAPEVRSYDLLSRTTFMDMPEESHPWELPVRPISGQTWLPGASEPISNFARVGRALPALTSCYVQAPRLTRQLLDPDEYGYCANSLSSVYRLAKLADIERRYDIAHAHFGPVGNRFRLAKQLWDIPFVVTFYGYDFSVVPHKEGEETYSKLFACADRVIAISNYAAGRVKRLGCPESKLRVIPLGIDTRKFAFRARPAPPLKVLTVARLVEKKGLEYSLRAFVGVRNRWPDARYEIIGDGLLRSKLEKLANDLKISEAVWFHGAQDAEFVRAKMAEAHLFVLSSVTAEDGDQEGQGVALIEAQASGVPVIATNHAAFPESIVIGRSGFLVPERNAEDLSAKMIELLAASESWSGMGSAGRHFAEQHFDISTLNRKLESMYLDLIKSRHA